MVKQVKKKSGEVEPFIREKVVVSCLKAGAPVSVAREIADMVEASQTATLTTKEIREDVIGELEKANAEYRRNWMMYDREKGRITP
jgi:transcriptional repressor NrdR